VWTDNHIDRIRTVVESYDDSVSLLVRQPEALILWERLEEDAVETARAWSAAGFPRIVLEDLAVLWGADIPEWA
jgi:hypothetical protein